MPVVYARNLKLSNLGTAPTLEAFSSAIRDWVGSRWPTELEWFHTDEAGSRKSADGSIFRWEPFSEGSREIADFTWRHADSDDEAISWITTATCFTIDGRTRVVLRVSNTWEPASSAEFKATTRPRFVIELARRFHVEGSEGPLATSPNIITEGDVPYFARYELFDHDRAYPVVVLTPTQHGDFLVDPAQLTFELLSLARVVTLPTPASTFALTRELGSKSLSVFHGAARLYQPGFSHSSDPFSHPLLLPNKLTLAPHRLALAQTLALGTVRTYRDEPAIPLLRDERAVAYDRRRAQHIATLAVDHHGDLAQWQELAQAYALERDDLHATRKDLENEVRSLRDRIHFYENKVSALEYQLNAKRVSPLPDDGALWPTIEVESVREAVDHASLLFGDDLTILPSALVSADDSPYDRPKKAFEILKAMADVSRLLRKGPLGHSLKEAFQEHQLDYRQGIDKAASKQVRAQHVFHNGDKEYFCEEHLCEGNSYDPRFSLRVYFVSLPGIGIVVGHIGRHLDTDETT